MHREKGPQNSNTRIRILGRGTLRSITPTITPEQLESIPLVRMAIEDAQRFTRDTGIRNAEDCSVLINLAVGTAIMSDKALSELSRYPDLGWDVQTENRIFAPLEKVVVVPFDGRMKDHVWETLDSHLQGFLKEDDLEVTPRVVSYFERLLYLEALAEGTRAYGEDLRDFAPKSFERLLKDSRATEGVTSLQEIFSRRRVVDLGRKFSGFKKTLGRAFEDIGVGFGEVTPTTLVSFDRLNNGVNRGLRNYGIPNGLPEIEELKEVFSQNLHDSYQDSQVLRQLIPLINSVGSDTRDVLWRVLGEHFRFHGQTHQRLPEVFEDLLNDDQSVVEFVLKDEGIFRSAMQYGTREQLTLLVDRFSEVASSPDNRSGVVERHYRSFASTVGLSKSVLDSGEVELANVGLLLELLEKKTKSEPFADSLQEFYRVINDDAPGVVLFTKPHKFKVSSTVGNYTASDVKNQNLESKQLLLYVSSCEEQKSAESAEVSAAPKKREIVAADNLALVDVFGAGVILDPQRHEDAFQMVLSRLSKNGSSPEYDKLLDQVVSAQQKYRQRASIVSGKNQPDVFQYQKRPRGVRAVLFDFLRGDDFASSVDSSTLIGYVPISAEGSDILFAVNPQVLSAKVNGKGGTTFLRGHLNNEGELNVYGTDRDFVGSHEQLVLNLAALRHWSLPFYISPEELTKDHKGRLIAIREKLASWNRVSRKFEGATELPKLGFSSSQSEGIPAVLPGWNRTVYLQPQSR